MRYLRGEILGLFLGELGIQPRARIAIIESSRSLLIWDLDAGIQFTLDFKSNALDARQKPAPDPCRDLFVQPDSALLARLADPNLIPWSEERETLVSELRYRNLPHETRPSYPIRPMLHSLSANLGSRLNPLRLLRRPSYGS